MWDQKPSFRFEIDNFSEKEAVVASRVFVAGECEWYLSVHPKGAGPCNDHLSLYLNVANRKSLRTGWTRSAKYYFIVLNESDKELYRSSIGKASDLFCAWSPGWGIRKTLPLSKFQEMNFLENEKLIIEVYIQVIDSANGDGGDINGFQVFAAHVASVKKIFAEHVVKKEYKNTLSNACSKLSELGEVRFNLDWLKSKFDEVSFKKKNADGADESVVQQHEERIKNLELMESSFKMDCLKSKLEEIALGMKKSCDADGSRVQKLELMELRFKLNSLTSKLEKISLEKEKSYDTDESRAQLLEKRVKKIELMEIGVKLNSLKSNLVKLFLERKKSCDADESRAQQLEERVKNLEVMELGLKLDSLNSKLDNADESRVQQLEERVKELELMNLESKLGCLNTKIEVVSLERKKSDDADGSRFQQLEESVKNIELMVSYLKVELDKKKDKSFADGFLLVN